MDIQNGKISKNDTDVTPFQTALCIYVQLNINNLKPITILPIDSPFSLILFFSPSSPEVVSDASKTPQSPHLPPFRLSGVFIEIVTK